MGHKLLVTKLISGPGDVILSTSIVIVIVDEGGNTKILIWTHHRPLSKISMLKKNSELRLRHRPLFLFSAY